MDRDKYIDKIVAQLREEFDIKTDIQTKADRRLKSHTAVVEIYNYKDNWELFYFIKYNPYKINKLTKMDIKHVILHEIGHIYFRHIHCSKKEMTRKKRIECEYEAEKFAIDYIRKNHPKYYKRATVYIEDYESYDNTIYKKAFGKLWKEIRDEK